MQLVAVPGLDRDLSGHVADLDVGIGLQRPALVHGAAVVIGGSRGAGRGREGQRGRAEPRTVEQAADDAAEHEATDQRGQQRGREHQVADVDLPRDDQGRERDQAPHDEHGGERGP